MLLETFTYEDFGPEEARILVVDLLVRDVALNQAGAMETKDVAYIFVNYLISSLLGFG